MMSLNRWSKPGRQTCSGGTGFATESGQALVEIAAGLSLLVIILLGAGQFGQIAFTSIRVANAAKAGVQYAAQSGFTAQDSTGITRAALAAAPSLTTMTVNSSSICTCWNGSTVSCTNLTACNSSRLIQTVTVTTQYTLTPIIHLPALSKTITLSGSAIQNCSQ